MNTIKLDGTYKKVLTFMRTGGELFNDNENNEMFKQYYNYLLKSNFVTETIQYKLIMLFRLLKYLETNNFKLKTISKKELYDYIAIISSMNYSVIYQEHIKGNLKRFLNWAYQNNHSKISGDMLLPKIIIHKRNKIRTYYTKEEIIKLMSVIDTNSLCGKEHFLIISLMCYLGLRISDVVHLKLSDIDFNENTISIIQQKTKEKLFLPLIEQLRYLLIDYLKNVRPNDCELDYVFVTRRKPYKHNINLKRRNYIIRNYIKKADIDINGRKSGFHALRHSFSTLLLSENIPLYSISKILGHQSLNTTMCYLDIDISKLKELSLEVPIC